MKNTIIKKEPSYSDDLIDKEKFPFARDGSLFSENEARSNLKIPIWRTTVSNAYDLTGKKPPKRHSQVLPTIVLDDNMAEMQRVSAARKEASRRRKNERQALMRSAHKERTTSIRGQLTQQEEPRQTMITSGALRDFELMRAIATAEMDSSSSSNKINLPPISQYIPSSSLSLAPLRIDANNIADDIVPIVPRSMTNDGSIYTTHEHKASSANRMLAQQTLITNTSPIPCRTRNSNTAKPAFQISTLIGKAILSAPTHRMTSRQISAWITETFPYYQGRETSLRKYVSRSVSKNTLFEAVDKVGCHFVWRVVEGMEGKFV